MQSIEAFFSLLFFIIILNTIINNFQSNELDNSLYKMQLAEDSWRVLYLRGNFHDMNRENIENDMEVIGNQTDLCIFIDGIKFTNCRGLPKNKIISLTKNIFINNSLQKVTFSIYRD